VKRELRQDREFADIFKGCSRTDFWDGTNLTPFVINWSEHFSEIKFSDFDNRKVDALYLVQSESLKFWLWSMFSQPKGKPSGISAIEASRIHHDNLISLSHLIHVGKSLRFTLVNRLSDEPLMKTRMFQIAQHLLEVDAFVAISDISSYHENMAKISEHKSLKLDLWVWYQIIRILSIILNWRYSYFVHIPFPTAESWNELTFPDALEQLDIEIVENINELVSPPDGSFDIRKIDQDQIKDSLFRITCQSNPDIAKHEAGAGRTDGRTEPIERGDVVKQDDKYSIETITPIFVIEMKKNGFHLNNEYYGIDIESQNRKLTTKQLMAVTLLYDSVGGEHTLLTSELLHKINKKHSSKAKTVGELFKSNSAMIRSLYNGLVKKRGATHILDV